MLIIWESLTPSSLALFYYAWQKQYGNDATLKGNLHTKQFARRYCQGFIHELCLPVYQIWGPWSRKVAFYGDFLTDSS